ncbi:hypothetical protein RZS08_30990, partial [Arthrospira platensis SPKY1]|nr:hypothetical protein [Arthrospira platensis SPKY1]
PTYINPVTGTFWDENGKPSEMDGGELGAVTVSASRNSSSSSPSFYNHGGFGLWGNNRFGDLGGHRNGTRKHSIEASNLPTDKLNGSAKSLNIFKSAIHFIYRNIKINLIFGLAVKP